MTLCKHRVATPSNVLTPLSQCHGGRRHHCQFNVVRRGHHYCSVRTQQNSALQCHVVGDTTMAVHCSVVWSGTPLWRSLSGDGWQDYWLTGAPPCLLTWPWLSTLCYQLSPLKLYYYRRLSRQTRLSQVTGKMFHFFFKPSTFQIIPQV